MVYNSNYALSVHVLTTLEHNYHKTKAVMNTQRLMCLVTHTTHETTPYIIDTQSYG